MSERQFNPRDQGDWRRAFGLREVGGDTTVGGYENLEGVAKGVPLVTALIPVRRGRFDEVAERFSRMSTPEKVMVVAGASIAIGIAGVVGLEAADAVGNVISRLGEFAGSGACNGANQGNTTCGMKILDANTIARWTGANVDGLSKLRALVLDNRKVAEVGLQNEYLIKGVAGIISTGVEVAVVGGVTAAEENTLGLGRRVVVPVFRLGAAIMGVGRGLEPETK